MNDIKQVTFIDLFCGIGSFHHSLSALGWKCVFACDIDENCQNTYEKNHGIRPAGDITQIDPASVPPFDVLCAGFPCQPFSTAGNRRGFSDSGRGNMFQELMRFVAHHSPKCVILENVTGLVNHDEGRTLQRIISDLEQRDYNVLVDELTCSDYGIPQMRKRIFIIAAKCDIPSDFLRFQHVKSKPLSQFLNHGRPRSACLVFTEKTVAYTIRCGGKHSSIDGGHNWDGYRAKRTGFSDEFVYRLTINDCLKLQGFNEHTFVMVGSARAQWKMLGNTIPTNLTRLVGTAVHQLLHLQKKQK
jgi:DNA-cytosine methyltransferase